jgi:hypothetical protein
MRREVEVRVRVRTKKRTRRRKSLQMRMQRRFWRIRQSSLKLRVCEGFECRCSRIVESVKGAFQSFGRRPALLTSSISFAFLDFKSVEQATQALANRRNHFLYNRKLKIQVGNQARAYIIVTDPSALSTPRTRPRNDPFRLHNETGRPSVNPMAQTPRPVRDPPADTLAMTRPNRRARRRMSEARSGSRRDDRSLVLH